MDAKEARKQAESNNNESNSKIIKEIEKLIETAVHKGDFDCTYFGTANQSIKAWFEFRDYEFVFHADQRDGDYYKIRW